MRIPKFVRRLTQLTAGSAALIVMTGCGPVHPRWLNAGQTPIIITYARGKDKIELSLSPGKQGIPMAFFDFQQVQKIDVKDNNRVLRLGRKEIDRLHNECGHGFRCRINYFGEGHLSVTIT